MSNRHQPPKGATVTADRETFAPISRHTQRGRPFGPGNPGRPFPPGHSGRPKGAQNKATTMLKKMFEGEAQGIGRRAVELAKEGRVGAIKLVLDRAYPARSCRTVEGLRLPVIASARDAVAAMNVITAGVSAGTLAIEDARDLASVLDMFRKMHELAEIEQRIVALERGAAVSPRT